MRRSLITTAVLAGALALAACGSKDGGSAGAAEGDGASSGKGGAVAAADHDPCSYLTAEEATAITTDAVVETVRSETNCRYKSNPDDGLQVTVSLGDGIKQMGGVINAGKLLSGIGEEVAKKGGVGADAAAAMSPGGAEAPKLGDQAAWGPASMLSIRKGDNFVQITPPMIHDPANHSGYPIVKDDEKRKIAIAVAEKVLAKL